MGLKYKIEFKTIEDKHCEVLLDEKGYTGDVMDLTAGGNPFRIDMDDSGLNTPIRSSSATLTVCGSDYLQALYTNDPFGVKVTLKVDGEVHWLGYLTPDTFSQDFTRPEFEYEMECVSALSVLKYKEFDIEDGFVRFLTILRNARDAAGFTEMYLTKSVRTATGSFSDLRIAAANFWDELDKPMTYYQVLEEIAKYAGCTFVPFGSVLYLLDYQAIRAGFNSYERVLGSVITSATLADAKTVDSYKGTDTKLSRIAGKNKATVNCSLYEIKDILPAFDNEGTKYVDNRKLDGNVNGKIYDRIIRTYSSKKFTFFKYDNLILGDYEDDKPVGLDDVMILGAELGAGFARTAYFPTDEKPSKLNLDNEVFVRRFSSFKEKVIPAQAKLFKMSSNRSFYIHPDVYFCINFQTRTQSRLDPYTADGKIGQTNYVSAKFDNDGVFKVPITFRIGEYYHNGSGWQKTQTTFNVDIPYKKGTQILDVYRGLDNTNEYNTGLGDLNGYIFKAPDFIISGDCEMIIHDYRISTRVSAQYLFFKDISLAYSIPDEQEIYGDWVNEDSRNDVIYENEIGEYIEEADEVSLKICTNVDKKIALSSVIHDNVFLKNIVTDVFGADVAENILIKRIVDMFSKTRFVINPVLENHAKPWTIFTEPHLNKKFMVAGGEEDVKMESTRYNLIEL